MDFNLNRRMSINKSLKNDPAWNPTLIFGNETYGIAGKTRVKRLKEYHSEKSRLPKHIRTLGHHRWRVKG